MNTLNRVAILGAGNVGKALAGSLVGAGYDVVLSAAHEGSARAAADATGARAADSNAEAVAGADVVMLAVPVGAVEAIAMDLGGALGGKIVVDVTNRPTPIPIRPPRTRPRSPRNSWRAFRAPGSSRRSTPHSHRA